MAKHLSCKCAHYETAIIKKLPVEGVAYKRFTPVWCCSHCKMTAPVKYEDRNTWVDHFVWHSITFLHGLDRDSSTRCIGCECERPMLAEIDLLLENKLPLWPLKVEPAPVWVCSICGYTSKILGNDRYTWAQKYSYWS